MPVWRRHDLLISVHSLAVQLRVTAPRNTFASHIVFFFTVDGLGGIEEEVLRDRRHIAEDGLVVVILGIEQQTGELLSGPDLLSRGFLPSTNGEGFEAAKEVIRTTLSELPRESLTDTGVVKERVRQSLRRYFRRTLGRRPVVLPFVLEM